MNPNLLLHPLLCETVEARHRELLETVCVAEAATGAWGEAPENGPRSTPPILVWNLRSLGYSSRRSDSSPIGSWARGFISRRRSPSGRLTDPAASVIGSPTSRSHLCNAIAFGLSEL